MDKVLKLLVDDFGERGTSAEYRVILHKHCEIERPLIASLNDEQKKEYFKLESMRGELQVQGFNDFAEFLLLHLKEIL
jgi:formylmethanofuran dehydrogenase subunit B